MPIGDANNMHETSDIIAEEMPAQPKGLRDIWNSRIAKACRRIITAILYRAYRLIGEFTAVVLGLGIALLWMTTSVLDRQSTDLTLLRPNIKLWFADAFDGRDAEFGKLELRWLPSGDQVEVTIEDARINDDKGELIEQFDIIRSTFSFEDGFFKKPKLLIAEVRGGVLSLLEDEEGNIVAGLGPPGAVGRVGPVYRSAK